MSSAFYPLGSNTYNNRVPQGGYKSWKGSGIHSNPIGITSGNMRPQTNLDYRNVAIYKHGSPRPMKHYRKGISVPITLSAFSSEYAQFIADYYSNTNVKSSSTPSLVGQLMDNPGGFIVKDNQFAKTNAPSTNAQTNTIDNNCTTCNGIGLISSWFPINNLSEKPQDNVTNDPPLCCNNQQKASVMVLPSNTNLPNNYYVSSGQYLYNRCQTYDQRAFDFVSGTTNPNMYIADCNPQDKRVGCKLVAYKPNNPQFAQQGSVKSSTRLLKLKTSTIGTNIINIQQTNGLGALSKGAINLGGQPSTPFIYKSKTQPQTSSQCIM